MGSTPAPRGTGLWISVRQWLFEIFCFFGSIVFLVVMVAVLNVYNNQPIPSLPGSVSLNSAVAVITVLAKGCFMVPLVECISQWKWNWFRRPRSVNHFDAFDQASRGLWGSIVLVWKLKCRHAVAFGALIYIISIIVSLFTQETIEYEPGIIETGGPRAASARQVYHWGLDDLAKKSGALAVDAALMTSLFDNKDSQTAVDLVPRCSSANCTYPEVATLSVCSQVVEITSSVTRRDVFNVKNHPWALLSDDHGLILEDEAGPDGRRLMADLIRNSTHGSELTLPNGLVLDIPAMNVIYTRAMNDSVAFTPDDDRYRVGLVSMIALFYSGASWVEAPQFLAYEVFFHMCVNKYNLTVVNNKARSNLLSSYSTPVVGGSGTNHPLACGANITCRDIRNSTGDSHIAFRIEHVQYSLDTRSAEYVGTSIARYLTGWRAANHDSETAIHGHSAYKLLDNFDMNPIHSPRPGLEILVRRAAAGLNQVLQNTRWGNSILVWGTAWENAVFVRVQWEWLGLLAGEICLAVVFFGYTVYVTHQMGVRPLKSSSMATLLALDPQSRIAVEDMIVAKKQKKKRRERGKKREWIKVRLSDRSPVLIAADEEQPRVTSDEKRVNEK